MKKKFTMLLASLLCCVGATNAQVTKYYKPDERVATLTAGQKVMFYNTCLVVENDAVTQDRTGFLVDNGSSLALSKTKPAQKPVFSEKVGVWTIETVEDNTTYYKVSVRGSNGYVGILGATNNNAVRDLYIHKWTEAAADKKAGVGSENAAGETVANANISASDNLWLVANGAPGSITNTWNGNTNSFATWSTGHPYAIYSVVEAETADLEALLATAKSDAVTVLGDLAKLTISTAATAITEVNAVVLENNDLEAALNAIDAIVLGAKKSMDGKSIVFDNTHTDGRAGLSITAMNGNAYGTKSEGDETIWTIKSQADGSFKLYNFVTNKYLNTPGTAALTDEAGAACYKFIGTKENTVALVTTKDNKMLHQANYWEPNYNLISYYDLNDAASLWTITEKEIKVSREQYDLATAARASLPYAIQQAYGLVTDAAKYTSNAMQTNPAEGSYANLLDNDYSSYFHTSWSAVIGADHYLQAEVSEEVKDFCFYFKKRDGNNNNRPTEIEVQGSSDGDTFTTITTITDGLPTDAGTIDYFSAPITAESNVKYIRFVVKSTNSGALDNQHSKEDPKPEGHPFFTFSEFYIFPATSDVTALIDSYNAFATASITSDEMANAAEALVNAEATLSLANIKKEIGLLLSANENNHAADPALGQYSDEGYYALESAYEDLNATEKELEEAKAAFAASLNRPVYIISSAWDAGYPAGKAIYYDRVDWRFDTANRYNRNMWMTIPGYANEDVPAVEAYDANNASYSFCDYMTGAKMRDKDVQIVKIKSWEDAYNLQYGTTAYDAAMHAEEATGKLVGWNPATLDGNQASAWRVEYIGNSFDLDRFPTEKLSALYYLQSAFDSKVYLYDAVFGDGVGEYQGDPATVGQPLIDAAGILSLALKVLAAESLTIAEIETYTAALNDLKVTINIPEDGKYYRIWGANSNVKPAGHYITNQTNSDGGRIALTEDANATTIYHYKDGKLQAYQDGKYIGLSSSHWTFADDAASASDIVFAASSYVAGAYTIKSADRYLRYKVYDGEAEIDRTESVGSANDAWFLQELETKTITYIYKAGKSELARQEVEVIVGATYPIPTATLPLGYIAPAALDGIVGADDTEKEIACTFDKSKMPFQYADKYENIEHWYYLNIAANGYYLYHDANATYIALNNTNVDVNNKDAYSWAFVGNPTDGFKLYNKAAGSGMILSSSTTMSGTTGSGTYPVMTAEATLPAGNNTYWIHSKSSDRENRDGFYLEQKGYSANKMNNRSNKLAYWSTGKDRGSTFVAVEQYEMTQPYSGIASWEQSPVYPEGLKTGAASGSHGSAAEHVGATGHSVYKYTKAIITTEADVTVSFNYVAPNSHGLIILGVDVVNGNGDVVASDYHVGFTGGAQDNKVYTLRNFPAGNYILRCYVCNKDDGTNHHLGSTGGNIVVNFAKELTDVDAVSTMWETLNKTGQSVLAYKGEGLGYYNNTEDVEVKIAVEPEKTVSGYTAAFVALDDAIDSTPFALPEAGKFYRFSYDYGDAGVKYVQAVASNASSKANGMLMSAEQGVASIFYYDGGEDSESIDDDKLLSYSTGQYVRETGDTRGLQAVGSQAGAASFAASTVPGKLYIYAGDSFHANQSGDVYFVDHCGSGHNPEHNFTVEEVTELPVTVSAVGYATFYTPVAVTIPGTVTAYVISETATNSVVLKEVTGVVPAGTGLILEGEEGVHTFAIATEGIPAEFDKGLLEGSAAKTLVTPEYGYTCYVLANGSQGVGLYTASLNKDANGETVAEGVAFINNGCKVYLPVANPPAGQAARALMFRFGGTTEIENVEATANGQQPTAVYDLSGRRVLNPTKGMYIVNGKKVVIK